MSHCSCLSIRLKKQKNKQENKSRNKDAQVVSNWYFSEFLYNCEGKSRRAGYHWGRESHRACGSSSHLNCLLLKQAAGSSKHPRASQATLMCTNTQWGKAAEPT